MFGLVAICTYNTVFNLIEINYTPNTNKLEEGNTKHIPVQNAILVDGHYQQPVNESTVHRYCPSLDTWKFFRFFILKTSSLEMTNMQNGQSIN